MPSPHRQLQKAIRIRQYQEGQPNNEVVGGVVYDIPYRDAVLADEPVFAYVMGNGNGVTNQLLNQAYRTADPSNTGTASSDVYDHPTLDGNNHTSNHKGLYFDCSTTTGSPSVVIPYDSAHDVGTAFSFEALFRPNVAPEYLQLFSSGDQILGGVNAGYYIEIDAFEVILGYRTANLSDITGVAFPTTLNANELYHLVVTVDNSSATGEVNCYLNGTLVGTDNLPNETVGNSGSNQRIIGAYNASATGTNQACYSGAIQAVCQYDKILTQADVTRHYEALDNNRYTLAPAVETPSQAVVNILSPQAFWRFNGQETGGATVGGFDETSNNNDGTRFNDVQVATTSLWFGGKSALFLPKSTSDVAYYETGVSSSLQHNSTSTLSATICPTKNAGDETWISNKIMSLGSMGTTSARQFGWRVDSSGYLELKYYITSTTFNTIQSTIPIPNFVADGSTAYEVAMTLDESTNELKFYSDGEQLGDTITFNDAIVGNAQSKVFIGTWGDDAEGQDGFYGFLDNIGYWQRILSDIEIRTLHSLAGNVDVDGGELDTYVARWSFDDAVVGNLANQPTDERSYFSCDTNSPPSDAGAEISPVTAGNAGIATLLLSDGYDGGNALRFAGSDGYVDTSPPSYLQFSNSTPGSVSFWIRPTGATNGLTIMSCGNDGISDDYGWRIRFTSSGGLQYVERSGAGATSVANAAIGSAYIIPNEWQHVCWVRDGSDIRAYHNGIDVTSGFFITGSVSYSVAAWALGGNSGSPTNFVSQTLNNCDLDEIHYFDRVLTDQEVLDLSRGAVPNHSQTTGLSGLPMNVPTQVEGYDEVVNGAYSFNGTNQYISLPSSSLLEPTPEITVTAWIKPSTKNLGYIFQSSDASITNDNGVRVFTRADGGVQATVGRNTGVTDNVDRSQVYYYGNLVDGNWHHIACTYDGSLHNLYVDGVVVDQNSYAGGLVYASGAVGIIGGRNTATVPDFTFDGELDDVRLYDFELNTEQVYYLARTTIPPKPQDMIGEWKFENNLNDNVGSNNLTNLEGTASYISGVGWENQGNQFSGSCLGFDSNASYENQIFSVSIWAQALASSLGNTQFLIGNYYHDQGTALYGWRIFKSTADIWSTSTFTGLTETKDAEGADTIGALAARKVKPDVWQHLCMVRSDTTVKLYIDGELVLESPILADIGFGGTTQQFTIGGARRISDYNLNFNGNVDEARYYNRELTADEVRALALRSSSAEAGVDPEAPLPPPSFPTLTLDVDVASITGNTSNGSGITYTSPTLTATAGGGSEQYEFTWTTDEPRLALVLGANGFDQSSTVNTNSFNILNGTSEIVTGTITCTLTDLGDGNATVQDTVPVSVTFGFTDDYVAYWDYETDQITGLVVADQTASNHDATLQVNAVAADGADGLGLNFNGSQYGVVVDNADFKAASFSFSTWVKASGTAALQGIFQSGGANTGKAGWKLFRNASNGLKLELGNDSGAVYETDWTDLSTANSIINSSEYKHVVVTYDGTTAKIYVNGTQAASKAWSGLAYPTTNYVVIGASHNGTSYQYPYVGDIDETKVYDRALSSVEVTELYNLARSPQSAPEPFSVLITNPASVIESVFPNGPISNTQDAVVTGGVGPFTYLWTKESGVANYDITAGSTSSTATIGGTGFGENFYVFKVVVTDTGNGNVTVEDTTTHIINFGAV